MKITGYKLQHTLRELAHRRDLAAARFPKSLWKFDDETTKATPELVMADYQAAEETIAKLQTAQGQYNLAVTVKVLGEPMTLAEAVKRIGGAGRMEKMWRTMATPKYDRYSMHDENVRETGVERAKRQITEDEAATHAKNAARFASALREAVQVANATEVEIELDPALFE